MSSRPSVSRKCTITGDGMHTAMVRQLASFIIEARDAEGNQQPSGGETFKVSVRGSSQVRARVLDKEDGTYVVEYKPSTSGTYSISVTLNGVSLPDSPMRIECLTPSPSADKCMLKGDALHSAKAREVASFEVEFVDALGQPARAEELDVWVERVFDQPDDPLDGELPSSVAGASSEGAPAASPATASAMPPSSPTAASSRFPMSTERTGGSARTSRPNEALMRSGGRVEVGSKPLIMREEVALDSPLVSVLRQGQMVTVLEERAAEEGKLRARVACVEEDPAARAIAESWWSPFDPASVEDMLANDEFYTKSSARSIAMSTSGLSDTYSMSSLAWALGTERKKKRPTLQGWVTLSKGGADLVARRPRLNAGERRTHLELWASREAADRAAKSALNAQMTKSGSDQKALHHVGPSFHHEISSDPMQIAFAFGGINPGTLHAAGKIVRTHTVKYTLGAAGKYKLHVGLRQQATALPNSPFNLSVSPSSAHAPSTSIPQEALPLKGIVGDDWSCECVLAVSDRMGNWCVVGGAPILIDVDGKDAEISATCEDNENGTYTLKWKGKVSGAFKTQVKIDGAHVLGSPTTIKMLAGPPDVPKCEISGGGLKTALAGHAAQVHITCKDRFSNPLSADSLGQGSALSFGLALLPPSQENRVLKDTVPSMSFDGKWVKLSTEEIAAGSSQDTDGESFEISYTAKEAGDFELHMWCDPDGSGGTRQWLSGSPFNVRVSGVAPSNSGSDVGDIQQLASKTIVAGEEVMMKPQLRDQYGNASAAQVELATGKSTFEGFVSLPDDSQQELELKQLKGLGAHEVVHEVNMKGMHKISFLLNGEHITGSPLEFEVQPDKPLGSKSRLFPPLESPIINQQCELVLEAIDKYGNKLDRGGARVDARANGPGVSACVPHDNGDGTYIISFTAAVVGETRVIVRLDNVEMAPLKLVFVAPPDGVKGKKGAVEAKPDAEAEAAEVS